MWNENKRFLYLILFLLLISPLYAQQPEHDTSITVSVEQELSRLAERQKRLNEQIDYQYKQINIRFNDLRENFNYFYILLASIIVLNGVVVASVIWMSFQDRPIGKRHYDQILERLFNLEEKIRILKHDIKIIKEHLEITD